MNATSILQPTIDRPRTRHLRVAVAGCGAVGGELVRLLQDGDAIQRVHGVRLELVRVLVRDAARPRVITFDPALLTDDLEQFLATPADIVVEAIGGIDPARRIAAAAIASGARLVTANKALIAQEGARLTAGARGSRVHFDAAVGGGVPIVRILRDTLVSAQPVSIRGILNGTSNFVLTRLERGASLDAALTEARARGLAEADPSRDLDGRDTADKVAILSWLAFGTRPHTLRVQRRGLLPDVVRLVRDAEAAGGCVRLLGGVRVLPGGVTACVEPVIVDPESPFGRTRNEENRVLIDLGWSAPLELAGPGAGSAPTGAALLADVLQSPAALPVRAGTNRWTDDPQPHEWSLSVIDDRYAATTCDAAGVAITWRGHQAGVARLHTGPATRAQIAAIEQTLTSVGAHPAVARIATAGEA